MGIGYEVTETVTISVISGVGSVIVAAIGAWAVVYTKRSKQQPGHKPEHKPSMSDRVLDDLIDRINSLEKQLVTTADRARKWEVEAAKLKTELAAAKRQRTTDGVLIDRLRTRVDEFERQAKE